MLLSTLVALVACAYLLVLILKRWVPGGAVAAPGPTTAAVDVARPSRSEPPCVEPLCAEPPCAEKPCAQKRCAAGLSPLKPKKKVTFALHLNTVRVYERDPPPPRPEHLAPVGHMMSWAGAGLNGGLGSPFY